MGLVPEGWVWLPAVGAAGGRSLGAGCTQAPRPCFLSGWISCFRLWGPVQSRPGWGVPGRGTGPQRCEGPAWGRRGLCSVLAIAPWWGKGQGCPSVGCSGCCSQEASRQVCQQRVLPRGAGQWGDLPLSPPCRLGLTGVLHGGPQQPGPWLSPGSDCPSWMVRLRGMLCITTLLPREAAEGRGQLLLAGVPGSRLSRGHPPRSWLSRRQGPGTRPAPRSNLAVRGCKQLLHPSWGK